MTADETAQRVPPYSAVDAVKHLRASVLLAWGRGLELAESDAEVRADALQALPTHLKDVADEHAALLAIHPHDRYTDGRSTARITSMGEGSLFVRIVHPDRDHPANSGTLD